jgi:DNA-binding transcriptional MerR regulator
MMGQYSIKELEQLSGIKAHTIRIWEKRYAFIKPQRTNNNIRYYSDDDLKKTINIALLNSRGFKISSLVGMSEAEITQKVLEISQTNSDNSVHVNELTVAMVSLDEEKFETTLSGFFLRYNFEQTVTEIVYPFLEKIGILWQTNNITPAQEHFISNLIRQKIIVGIDGLPLQPASRKKALLFLPENELHEIGLLFSHYIMRKSGYKTVYLGQAVPHKDLHSIYITYHPDILVTVLTSAIPEQPTEQYLLSLSNEFHCQKILVTGLQVRQLRYECPNNRVVLFQNAEELKRLISS